MKLFVNENGVTVKELKAILENWPDVDSNGEDSQVWMYSNYGSSSPVIDISKLNETDIIFDYEV